jgi:tRNA threonylcarbamoyladenosine biosynthesis protein TsaE
MTIPLADEKATAALARELSARVQTGDVIALFGNLGAGKTSFARAFITALPSPRETGIEETTAEAAAPEEVPSPTFTLVQLYERTPASVWHFDLYRLEQPEDAYELGIEEAFAEGISLIEWPERLGGLLPASRLELSLNFGSSPDSRIAELTAYGSWRDRLGDLSPPKGANR